MLHYSNGFGKDFVPSMYGSILLCFPDVVTVPGGMWSSPEDLA